jgi:hypothetical protein
VTRPHSLNTSPTENADSIPVALARHKSWRLAVLSENPIALLSRHLRKPGGSGSPSAECDDVGQVAGSGPFPTSLSVASSSLSLS